MGKRLSAPDDTNFSDLTPRQRKFIDEYLITSNKYKSALAAGYSPRSIATLAYKEFDNVRLQAYYQHCLRKISEKNMDNVGRLLKRLEEIAMDDINNYVDERGNVKGFDGKMHGRNVQSIRHTKTGVDITLCSREKAMELLCRYHGMLSDKMDVTTGGQPITPKSLNISFEEIKKDNE